MWGTTGPAGHDGGVPDDVHPLDDPADASALRDHATALADGIEAAIPAWVERSTRRVLGDQGIPVDAALADDIAGAAEAARADGAPRVRALLLSDVDDQAGNPLAIVRSLVRHPTVVLRRAGARPVVRVEFDERSFPDDVYGLTPASFADLDPSLHDPGMTWGAAKAYVHLARRRREGRR